MFLVQCIQYIRQNVQLGPKLRPHVRSGSYTLRPFGTLLFSVLPMMIWQKKLFYQNCQWWWFFSVKWQKLKLHLVISQKNCLCLTSLDDQIFKSFWKPNPWMNLLEIFFLLYLFSLYLLQFKSFPPWIASISHNLDKF